MYNVYVHVYQVRKYKLDRSSDLPNTCLYNTMFNKSLNNTTFNTYLNNTMFNTLMQ